MTTVMSSEGNSSRESESTDVPNYTEKTLNDGDANNIQINDHNPKSSPHKKFSRTFEMRHNSSNATLDSFTTLTSTKQNIELFKILTAIAVVAAGSFASAQRCAALGAAMLLLRRAAALPAPERA